MKAKAFQKLGWSILGQVGSHLVLIKPGSRVNLSAPQHKELSVGTLRSLVRNAGIDEFLKLLGFNHKLTLQIRNTIPELQGS